MQSGGGASGNSLGENGGGGGGVPTAETTGTSTSTSASANKGPHFDTNASKNVTALLGKTAYLNCRVKNLSNKTVSREKGCFAPGVQSPERQFPLPLFKFKSCIVFAPLSELGVVSLDCTERRQKHRQINLFIDCK